MALLEKLASTTALLKMSELESNHRIQTFTNANYFV